MSDVHRTIVTTQDHRVAGVLCSPITAQKGAPLLVCVHGGGCNGGYFDLKGASLVQAAVGRGMAVLQIDRPGYGASAMPHNEATPIVQGASAVHALVETVRAQPAMAQRPVALIGHSIGGAVALTYAAQSAETGNPPLNAVCVSGIGDRPAAAVTGFSRYNRTEMTVEPPADWFFGPEGTYSWKGVMALRAIAEPWRTDEVDEVIRDWPGRVAEVAGAITCPVHFRLAEFERIWENDADALRRISEAFTRTSVNAAILPEGGHLYEVHRRGAELIAAQLDFVLAQVDRA